MPLTRCSPFGIESVQQTSMESIAISKLVLIPVISAFIGWLTNWIAVKMLFHPRKPIHFGIFILQGIFHKRQQEVAHRLGDTIESKLISHSDIRDVIRSEQFHQKIVPAIEHFIDDFAANRLTELHPAMALLPSNMVEHVKGKLMEEFDLLIPKLMEKAGESLEEQMNIREFIRNRIENFDVSELESILFSILRSEFKMIEYIGGGVGFVIGVVQIVIILFF